MTMQCLGLDIGSSSIKGAILDLETGQVDSIITEPFPDPLPGLPAGWFEIDPLEVVARSRRVISQLLLLAPTAKSVFFCGQMGGVILVDRDTQSPLSNYLSWRDQRTLAVRSAGGSMLDEMRSRWEQHLPQLGQELKPGSTSSLLFWLQEQCPLSMRVRPANIGDFVISQLSDTLPRMEPTQAIGLLDLQRGVWHNDSFQRLGLDHIDWGPLSSSLKPVAYCLIEGRELTLFPTLGDQQCALRGAGLQIGDLSINVSTGSQVSCITREFTPGPYQSRFFFNGTYLNTITHVPAGRSLNSLVALLTELPKRLEGSGERFEKDERRETRVESQVHRFASNAADQPSTINHKPSPSPSPWPVIARAAANAADGAGGLKCNLSFFDSPLGREGQITGITTENLSVGNLFRAAFEAMAETYDHLAGVLWPDRSWKRVVLSGGLTRSVPILRELIERRFPGQVVESTAEEETLLGLLDVAREVHSRYPSRN